MSEICKKKNLIIMIIITFILYSLPFWGKKIDINNKINWLLVIFYKLIYMKTFDALMK
jgi:hypothetical protein